MCVCVCVCVDNVRLEFVLYKGLLHTNGKVVYVSGINFLIAEFHIQITACTPEIATQQCTESYIPTLVPRLWNKWTGCNKLATCQEIFSKVLENHLLNYL